MTLKLHIENDLKKALLSGDKKTATTLRSLKGSILNSEISNGVRDTGLSDDEIIDIVVKEIKKRSEATELYTKAKDAERAEQEQKEIQIIEKYLPRQLSDDELYEKLTFIVSNSSAEELKNTGLLTRNSLASVGKEASSSRIVSTLKSILAGEK